MSDNMSESKKHQRERDPDLVNAEIALKRAAGKDRELARKTGTAVVFEKNGQITEEQ